MSYYPAFLDLKGKKAVVVGGGRIAERKVFSLIRSGAEITVVSPSLTRRLSRAEFDNRIRHVSRDYRKGDLRDSFLVIAATDDPATNRKVANDAPALVNVVDVPSQCNFIAPSVVRRGQLIIAVSTSASSPAFSRTIRKELEKIYGGEFSGYLRFVAKMRSKAFSEIGNKSDRMKFLKGLASEKTLRILREKGLASARQEGLKLFAAVRKQDR